MQSPGGQRRVGRPRLGRGHRRRECLHTVEHLSADGRLDPVQEAFIEAGAFQCGFCTPGFVLMTKQLLDEHPDPSDEQIGHYLSGNLCRCGTYPEIIAAVKLAARKIRIHHGDKEDTEE